MPVFNIHFKNKPIHLHETIEAQNYIFHDNFVTFFYDFSNMPSGLKTTNYNVATFSIDNINRIINTTEYSKDKKEIQRQLREKKILRIRNYSNSWFKKIFNK